MNHIYFAGYDAQHPGDFVFDVPEGYDCCLLLITHTPARFWVEGKEEEYPANSAILYPPHYKIWYGACSGSYGNDWIRFASDEPFVRKFPLPARPFPVSDPAYCHSLFRLLTWETAQLFEKAKSNPHTSEAPPLIQDSFALGDPTASQGDMIISQLLHILFLKLRSDVLHHAASPHDHELLMLRRQITNTPQLPWNVAEMARQLHVSMGHLQLLYKQKFGISCMDDVIGCRIRKAKDLLAFSDQSIAEVAEQCGYQNVEHFCRQFRKIVGQSPGKFKKNLIQTPPEPHCLPLQRQ